MWMFVVSAWRSGLRGRSFQAVFVFGLLLLGVAWLASSFSPRQPQTVALDVGLSGLRFCLVLAVLFWVQDLVGKEIERRTVLFALTYPLPRWHYLVGRYLAIVSMAALVIAVLGLGLAAIAHYAGGSYRQLLPLDLGGGYLMALTYLWLDIAVVIAFTVLIAALSTTPMLPFALGAAFAMATHAIGPVLGYLERGAEGDIVLVAQYKPVLSAAQWLVPDLGRLDLRDWPLYGQAPELSYLIASAIMAIACSGLMLLLAVRSFSRREFS